ncbi:MAG: low temperature requirement protein A [Chloroflexi bacterium]|nr:MAG: low temperature requirement protein A [Chloroflexota bacterium]
MRRSASPVVFAVNQANGRFPNVAQRSSRSAKRVSASVAAASSEIRASLSSCAALAASILEGGPVTGSPRLASIRESRSRVRQLAMWAMSSAADHPPGTSRSVAASATNRRSVSRSASSRRVISGSVNEAIPTSYSADSAQPRVSSLELFFDLVFVFTITQLTTLLAREPTLTGLLQTMLIFGNVWWMYGGYAWLTNAVPPRELGVRLLLLVGMSGFLLIALAIPTAFGAGGIAFGVGYMIVTLVHTGVFMRTSQQSAIQALTILGPSNVLTAVLLLAAGFTTGGFRWSPRSSVGPAVSGSVSATSWSGMVSSC